MRILIGGHKGFIGCRLFESLSNDGFSVRGIGRSDGLDLTDPNIFSKIDKFDIFIHLAGSSYVPDSYEAPLEFYKNNILTTIHALELARANKASLIFFSSYVYGIPKYLPIDEKHPIASINPYAESKIIGERICTAYNRDFGVPVAIIRPFNVYGKGQRSSFLIPTIINAVLSEKPVVELKDSRPRRDFVHVDDVVSAVEALIPKVRELNFSTFNIGSGISHSIQEVADLVMKETGIFKELVFSNDKRPLEVLETVSDISKIKNELGWSPLISLQKGIQLSV